MAGSRDVSINISTKADTSAIAKTVREFESGISRLSRIGGDAAKPLVDTLITIKESVKSGRVAVADVGKLGALLVKQGLSAQSAEVQIKAYTAAVMRAAQESKKIGKLVAPAPQPNHQPMQLGDALHSIASIQGKVASSGLSGGGVVGDKPQNLKQKLLGVDLSPEDKSVQVLINRLQKLDSGAIDSQRSLAQLNRAVKGFSTNISTINSASRGGDIFERLSEQARTTKVVEELRKKIVELSDAVMDSDPDNAGLLQALDSLNSELDSENLDGKKIKALNTVLKSAADNVSNLGGNLSSRLAPKLLSIRDKIHEIENEKKKAFDADSISNVTSEIGNMSSAAQGFLSYLGKIGSFFPQMGKMLKSGLGGAVTAVVAVAVSAIGRVINQLKDAVARSAELDMKFLGRKVERAETRTQKERRDLDREIKSRDGRLSGARAVEDAAIASERAKDSIDKAGEMAEAQSEEERAAIDRKYERREIERQKTEKMRQIDREKEDTENKVGDYNRRIEALKKNRADQENLARELHAKRTELYDQSDDKLKNNPSLLAGTAKWFKDALGMEVSGETADQMVKELDRMIEDVRKKAVENSTEIKDLSAEIAVDQEKLGGEYFDKKKAAAEAEAKAAEENIRANEVQTSRGYGIENSQRARELRDRERDFEDQDRRNRQQQGEATYGFLAKHGANTENMRIAKERLDEYKDEMTRAEEEELTRLRELNPTKKYTSIKDVREEDLSATFKDRRSYLEGKIHSSKSDIKNLENEKFNIDLEGDTRKAELMKTARQGGSRLTALGIGGGDSTGFLRDTADNTRKIKDILTEMKTMKGLGDIRTMHGTGNRWTMN